MTAMGNERHADATPGVGQVDWGSLRRVTPITRSFGYERGQPIDRVYIERFLERHRRDIRGAVVEIGDNRYTRQFGGEQVTRSEVLDQAHEGSNPSIAADLTQAAHVASDQFDCVIFTQTLQFIYDARAAIRTLQRILKPGGVLLGSFPTLSQICRYDMDRWGDYWRFTSASVRRLLGDEFGSDQVDVTTHGNVLVATAFLYGLAAEELTPEELDAHDPDYEVVITARAVKSAR
jgi:SAM-dependent methyltransferase